VACQQVGDKRDAVDVRVAVGFIEAQLLAQVLAHRVAVEQLHAAATRSKRRLQRPRDGALAGAREPREPHREPCAHRHLLSSHRSRMPRRQRRVELTAKVGAPLARALKKRYSRQQSISAAAPSTT
jgi:hypothetical protein